MITMISLYLVHQRKGHFRTSPSCPTPPRRGDTADGTKRLWDVWDTQLKVAASYQISMAKMAKFQKIAPSKYKFWVCEPF